jgi:hypothetical protein
MGSTTAARLCSSMPALAILGGWNGFETRPSLAGKRFESLCARSSTAFIWEREPEAYLGSLIKNEIHACYQLSHQEDSSSSLAHETVA